MNKMDTAMLRHELQGLIDNHTPRYEVERIARRALQFMDQQARLQSLLEQLQAILAELKA